MLIHQQLRQLKGIFLKCSEFWICAFAPAFEVCQHFTSAAMGYESEIVAHVNFLSLLRVVLKNQQENFVR